MAQGNPSGGFGLGAFFANRCVVVTGASSGIGYDVALAFGERGAKVALLARRKELLAGLADKIAQAGGVGVPIACDVTNRQQVLGAIDESHRALGGMDILVNSAGILLPSKFEEMKPGDLKKMLDVNLFGTVHAMQAVLPLMRTAGRGSSTTRRPRTPAPSRGGSEAPASGDQLQSAPCLPQSIEWPQSETVRTERGSVSRVSGAADSIRPHARQGQP